MGTCKLRAGDRRESVIGYRSPAAKASSAGDGLSNYPAGRPAGRAIRPLPPRGKERPGAALAGAKKPVRCLGRSRGPSGAGMGRRRAPRCALPSGTGDAPHAGSRAGHADIEDFSLLHHQDLESSSSPPSLALRDPARGARPAGRGRRVPACGASTCAPRQRRPEGQTRARSYHVPLVYSSRCREQQRPFLLQLFPNFSPAGPSGGRCPSSPRPVRVFC